MMSDYADLTALADALIDGRRLTREDDLSFLIDCPLDGLCREADRLRAHFIGDTVELCSIINGRSGRCSEDCRYCAQSSHYHTDCKTYAFLDEDTIVAEARANQEEHVGRFSIVTSGRALSGDEFNRALSAYRRMHEELSIELCASHGFLTEEQFRKLKAAGVTRYHDNIETSRRFFPEICTTHTFDQKLETIGAAKRAGLEVCSGGIIGLGETFEDRIDMALTLAELEIRSIPINVLMAIPGTPLEAMPPLSEDEILRTFALFRFIVPEAHIRLAGGRRLMEKDGIRAFCSGASAALTGNMLTTCGATIRSDMAMLAAMGRDTTPHYR